MRHEISARSLNESNFVGATQQVNCGELKNKNNVCIFFVIF